MLRLWATFLAWFSIITVGVTIIGMGFAVKYYAGTNYPPEDSTYKWLNIAAYTIWGLAGIYALVVLCTYYAIKISIKVLKVSAKIISRNLRMVIVPLIGIVVMCIWICFYAYSVLWLVSCGDMTLIETPVGSYYSYTWSNKEKWMMWFSLFLFFWISAFLLAASQYVLIVGVANWYFKAEKKD